MRGHPFVQFCVDLVAGLLIGALLGVVLGMAMGLICGFIFFCLPFLAIIGILVISYGLAIGVCSGAITGLACGAITGGRVTGVNLKTLPFVGFLTGAPPAILVMQWFQQHQWHDAKPAMFLVGGAIAGGVCGLVVALVIGLLNRRRIEPPPFDIVV